MTDAIEQTCRHSYPFEIILNNYNFFPHHTLYIDIKNLTAVANLVKGLKSVKENSALLGTRYHFYNHPHLTIARGFNEETFIKAKKDFESRTYKNSFIADSIVLLKRKTQNDKCLVIKEFEFCDTRSFAVA